MTVIVAFSPAAKLANACRAPGKPMGITPENDDVLRSALCDTLPCSIGHVPLQLSHAACGPTPEVIAISRSENAGLRPGWENRRDQDLLLAEDPRVSEAVEFGYCHPLQRVAGLLHRDLKKCDPTDVENLRRDRCADVTDRCSHFLNQLIEIARNPARHPAHQCEIALILRRSHNACKTADDDTGIYGRRPCVQK